MTILYSLLALVIAILATGIWSINENLLPFQFDRQINFQLFSTARALPVVI